ncbi:hypothetical protein E0I74_26540 [Rhizobium laguerreae]|nr:hypothetical protein E0I74_26540 [Rhizobium laguerreae]
MITCDDGSSSAIAERLKGALLKDSDVSAWLMNVTDEQGVTVIVLSFTAAVQIVDHVYLAGQVPGAL